MSGDGRGIDYRSVCSAATLQSEQRGFFIDLAELVEAEAGRDWLQRFARLSSHEERIRACMEDKKVRDVVHGTLAKVQPIFRGKASRFARSKMEEAEHWLGKGKLERALASANLAVIRAPISEVTLPTGDGGELAPRCLWLRSDILCRLSEFKLALNDIQLALKYHLPNNLKSEAYKRMGLCYLNLGEKKKALVSLNVATSSGDNQIKEECNQIIREIDSLLKISTENENEIEVTESLPEMGGLSSALTLCLETGRGRYYRAERDIGAGELVVTEVPYVTSLLVESHGTHCLHCFKRLKAPTPCPNCSGVGFCSPGCLSQGMAYHRWECPYLELAIGSGMSSLSHLSLRIITQGSLDYFKKALKMKNHTYQKVLALEGHLGEREARDLLHRTLMALFLLQILRHGGYFEFPKKKGQNIDNSTKAVSDDDNGYLGKLTDDEMLIASLLLTHLVSLQYNSHEVYETIIPKENIKSPGKTYSIGLGLYLNTSLFNHQCQPTLARYFHGTKLILRAQHPISAGEEVSENYGPVFMMRTKEQRQKVLNGRYLFDCNCEPCLMDWPKLDQMNPETAIFRCKAKNCRGGVSESGICQSCGKIQPIEDDTILFKSFQEDWERGVELFKSRDYLEAEKVILKYVRDMWSLVRQPNKNLCLAMEALRTIWANSSGNVSILPVPDVLS